MAIGRWTPNGERLCCPNCGRYMHVPPNPRDKLPKPPAPPSVITRVGGMMVFDREAPHVLVPAWVKLRPVLIESERRVVINAGLTTVGIGIPAIVGAEVVAMWKYCAGKVFCQPALDIGLYVCAAALITICVVLPLAIAHYVLADDEPKPAEPAPAVEQDDDEPTEPEPVGDVAGWVEREQTDGGEILRFYKPPRMKNGKYVSARLVRRMAIEIVNARGWVSERDMAGRGVPNAPYRLIRQDWLDRQWITAMPDKSTIINFVGRKMIARIATTEAGE